MSEDDIDDDSSMNGVNGPGVEPGKLVKLSRPAGGPLDGRVGPVVIQLLPE